MLDVLHWLPLQQRMTYIIAALVWRCLLGLASVCHRELFCPTLGVWGRCCLRSTELGLLLVPFASTSNGQNRAFSVFGPSVWNGLLLVLRLISRVRSVTFYTSLKLSLLAVLGTGAPLSCSREGVLYKSL